MVELSPKQKMRRQVNAIRMIHRMEKAARRVPVILLVAVWYGASCFAITTSKMAMQIAPAPFSLCLCQFLVAALISRVTMTLHSHAPRCAKLSPSHLSPIPPPPCRSLRFCLCLCASLPVSLARTQT